ncbi:hypothetical protein ACFOW1_08710 [Parasediminibacterium paludis]|uniref:Uncharacterized protein n=1 Tax=Parasediminibacterium paludis TaxID=908966 RepID=A0ABV8PV09_9BACT
MPRLTIEWTKYSFNPPDAILEDKYHYWNQIAKQNPQIFDARFSYLKEFWWEYSLIIFGLVYLYFDNLKPSSNSVMQWIGFVLVLAGLLSFLKVIISTYSFIKVYFKRKRYYNKLKEALLMNDNYNSFCQSFYAIDNRYKEF